MKRLGMFVGLASVALGGFLIFVLYAFSAMMNSPIKGAEVESAIWGKMTSEWTFWIALFFVVAGLRSMFSNPTRPAE